MKAGNAVLAVEYCFAKIWPSLPVLLKQIIRRLQIDINGAETAQRVVN